MTTTTRDQNNSVERYAHWNRLAERGDATGETLRELVRVCVELDKRDEAVAAFHGIQDPALRRAMRRELARLGWVSAENDPQELEAMMVTEAALEPSLRDKIVDAAQFLCEGPMRLHVVAGTVAFPVVLGVGGLLVSATDFFLFRLVAMLPAVLVVGALGELARRVLVMAIEGRDDAADLPDIGKLVRRSPRPLVDLAALAAVFLGPPALLSWLGAPLLSLPLLAIAALFMPLVTALRMTGTAWGSLTPPRLVAAVRCVTPTYPAVAGIIALLLAPAVLVLLLTVGMHVFVVLSVTGPLAVAPALMSARILGLTLHYQQESLAGLFPLPGGDGHGPVPGGRSARTAGRTSRDDDSATADPAR